MATQEPMGTTRTEEQRREEQRRTTEQSSAQRRQARVRRGDEDRKTATGTPGDDNGEQRWPFTQARTAEEQDAAVGEDGKNRVPDNSEDTASARATRRANTGSREPADDTNEVDGKQPRRTTAPASTATSTPTGGSSPSGSGSRS